MITDNVGLITDRFTYDAFGITLSQNGTFGNSAGEQTDGAVSQSQILRSTIRKIRLHEIVEAIANGQIIEDYPNDKYASSCLICGLTQSGRTVHIQSSYPIRPLVKIITVYEPDPKKWNDDFTVRKTNNE